VKRAQIAALAVLAGACGAEQVPAGPTRPERGVYQAHVTERTSHRLTVGDSTATVWQFGPGQEPLVTDGAIQDEPGSNRRIVHWSQSLPLGTQDCFRGTFALDGAINAMSVDFCSDGRTETLPFVQLDALPCP
jgi:hypothetical protein